MPSFLHWFDNKTVMLKTEKIGSMLEKVTRENEQWKDRYGVKDKDNGRVPLTSMVMLHILMCCFPVIFLRDIFVV